MHECVICTGKDYDGHKYKNINIFIILFIILSSTYVISSLVIIADSFDMIIECLLKNIWAYNLLSVVLTIISIASIIGIIKLIKRYNNISYVMLQYCVIFLLSYIGVMIWGGIELFINLHNNSYIGCINHPVCYDVKNSTIVLLGYTSFGYDAAMCLVCLGIPLIYSGKREGRID